MQMIQWITHIVKSRRASALAFWFAVLYNLGRRSRTVQLGCLLCLQCYQAVREPREASTLLLLLLRTGTWQCRTRDHGTALIERNIAQVMEILNFIKGYLTQGGAEANDVLKAICAHYEIKIRNVKQYFLLYPTLHSFLSHLSNSGEITCEIRDDRLFWHAIEGGDKCLSSMGLC